MNHSSGTVPRPNANRIYQLPNEILEQTMGYLDSIPSLHALAVVDVQAKLLFEARPQTMMLRAIKASSMCHHLQKHLCATLSIRQTLYLQDSRWLRESLGSYLEPRSWTVKCDPHDKDFEVTLDFGSNISQFEPMAMLEDAVSICRSIAEVAKRINSFPDSPGSHSPYETFFLWENR